MTNVSKTLSWSLDSSAGSTVSVLKDVMRAATSDNVQPLALISCEKFGATLAMCQETNKKMEDLIIKVSGPKYVRFMSAQIGYSANDSATQLSRSLAGVQFLGLAAALVSSMKTFEGADALSLMLMASASDKTLLPTVRQLKDLLGVMEHRVNRSGFTDIWVGYLILLFGGLSASSERLHFKRPEILRNLMQTPGNDGISKLVEAFRQISRLGDATAITVRATSCAPWVMAFTRWCLGVPPSTYLPSGKALLDQPTSRMTVITGRDEDNFAFEVIIQKSINSPADLLKSQASPQIFNGMVTVECLGQWRRQEMGGEGSLAYRAICEALPYALKQSCELLRVFDNTWSEPAWAEGQIFVEPAHEHHTRPLPEDFIISSILTRFLNSKTQQDLKCLDDRQLVMDLPLVHEYLHEIAELDGRRRYFLHCLSYHVAAILALSMFDNPERLLVSLHQHRFDDFRDGSKLQEAISLIIQSGKPTIGTPRDLLAWALYLVGHKDLNDEVGWVISCYQGQAVYPRVFETEDICQSGYLVLYWAPGLLFFDGEIYKRGTSPPRHHLDRIKFPVNAPTNASRTVTEPLNLIPNMRMEWKVVRRDDYLDIYLTCGNIIGQAYSILSNLSRALIRRGCPHDSALPLGKPDPCSNYVGPLFLEAEYNLAQVTVTSGHERQIGVVAVDRDAGLRMFVMSDTIPSLFYRQVSFVIRSNACLQCCLDLCRRAQYNYLIC